MVLTILVAFSLFWGSIPSFWLGYLLIFFFSVKLDLFPVEGIGTWQHLVLPSVTLALPLIALYTRLLRASVLENLQEPYILFARTRGIHEKVIMQTCIENSHIPQITGLGMNSGSADWNHYRRSGLFLARIWWLFY